MIQSFILWSDLLATMVFGIMGAYRAIKYELDIFGFFLLALITGVGGGILRDGLFLNITPMAFTDNRYIPAALLGGLIVFIFKIQLTRLWRTLVILDGFGLSLFTCLGVLKGIDAGLSYFGIVACGVVTAVGGGVLRDLFIVRIPDILISDVYALISLVIVMIMGTINPSKLQADPYVSVVAFVVFGLCSRIFVYMNEVSLPKLKKLPNSPSALFTEEL